MQKQEQRNTTLQARAVYCGTAGSLKLYKPVHQRNEQLEQTDLYAHFHVLVL